MASTRAVRWLDQPEDHDYPAAASYLALVAPPDEVDRLVAALRAAGSTTFKAKDILRAATLALLPVDNPHVASDMKKIRDGRALSPILLVRGELTTGIALQVADGYHRVCASYHTDENTDIPCRLTPTGRWTSARRPADRPHTRANRRPPPSRSESLVRFGPVRVLT
ncbi:MAG TPA: hypothetical protein VFP34_01715 [Microlunatus sp.]|nr:hypothetical protein [Microlunatus sp.]